MDRFFIDTDVTIDFLIDRRPFSEHSSLLFDLAERADVQLIVSSLSISNIYYLMRKLVGNAKSRELIGSLLQLVEIQDVIGDDIRKALTNGMKDFEDAIQYECAFRLKNIKAVVTRNTKDYKNSILPVLSPQAIIQLRKLK